MVDLPSLEQLIEKVNFFSIFSKDSDSYKKIRVVKLKKDYELYTEAFNLY